MGQFQPSLFWQLSHLLWSQPMEAHRFNPVRSFCVCILTTPCLHLTELFLKVQISTWLKRHSYSTLKFSDKEPLHLTQRKIKLCFAVDKAIFKKVALSDFKEEAVPFGTVLFLQFFHESHKPKCNNPNVSRAANCHLLYIAQVLQFDPSLL